MLVNDVRCLSVDLEMMVGVKPGEREACRLCEHSACQLHYDKDKDSHGNMLLGREINTRHCPIKIFGTDS